MLRFIALGAATAAILLLTLPAGAGTYVTTGATTGSTANSAIATRTIRLISTATGAELTVDRAPLGEIGVGDVLLASSRLTNAVAQFGKPKGAVVGKDEGTYEALSATKTRVRVTVHLPGGTLRVAGIMAAGARAGRLPVVAGTGAFKGVRGSVEVRNLDGHPLRASNVYRLNLP